jgi:DNA-binding response OmpR family regulator
MAGDQRALTGIGDQGGVMDFLFHLPSWRRKSAPGLVTVLLATADAANRRSVRQAVGRSMSANFIEVDGKGGLHSAVTFQEVDLIIADAEINGCRCFDIVEQIRYGRLHRHAFPVVILLNRNGGDEQGQQVMECGADLVMNAETADRFLPDQLNRLMQRRRPFVVTPHYTGPERRDDERSAKSTVTHLTVPNPLAARISGMADADYRRQISLAAHSISLMRRGLYMVRMTQAPVLVSSRTL